MQFIDQSLPKVLPDCRRSSSDSDIQAPLWPGRRGVTSRSRGPWLFLPRELHNVAPRLYLLLHELVLKSLIGCFRIAFRRFDGCSR
jgi:hypothetical protein